MAEAPRAEGFEWGFMALPAVNAGGSGCSFCWFEQMWIPAAAENQDMAKEFVAYMYSDEAAKILAACIYCRKRHKSPFKAFCSRRLSHFTRKPCAVGTENRFVVKNKLLVLCKVVIVLQGKRMGCSYYMGRDVGARRQSGGGKHCAFHLSHNRIL